MSAKKSRPGDNRATNKLAKQAATSIASDFLSHALTYATLGWPVLPLRPGSKVPAGFLVPNGVKDASTAPAVIMSWWSRIPLANVGIATGYPGPDALDFDVSAGKPGITSWRRLFHAGQLAGAHRLHSTPSGGRHLLFSGTDQGNGSIPRHGVDFRGRGGYIVAPPSIVDGRPYTVLNVWPQRGTTVDFNAVRRLLDPVRPVTYPQRRAEGNHAALVRHVAGLGEGNRNAGLFWAACRAVEGGADEGVFAELVDAAVSAGLTYMEADRTVRSARRRTGVAA